MKILGADVIGLERAVMINNSGATGVIVIDLSDLAIVEFKRTGEDSSNYKWYPGLVDLHYTGFPEHVETSVAQMKLEIAAHFLTLRETDIEPEDYSYNLMFAGSGLGRGESLLELYRANLESLTSRGGIDE